MTTNQTKKGINKTMVLGLITALVFVAVGTFLLSNSMETLDVAAEELGVFGGNILQSPFPEYVIPGFEDNVFATLFLGIISTILLFGVAWCVGKLLLKRKSAISGSV